MLESLFLPFASLELGSVKRGAGKLPFFPLNFNSSALQQPQRKGGGFRRTSGKAASAASGACLRSAKALQSKAVERGEQNHHLPPNLPRIKSRRNRILKNFDDSFFWSQLRSLKRPQKASKARGVRWSPFGLERRRAQTGPRLPESSPASESETRCALRHSPISRISPSPPQISSNHLLKSHFRSWDCSGRLSPARNSQWPRGLKPETSPNSSKSMLLKSSQPPQPPQP